MREHICSGSALGVVTVQGDTLLDFARGGAAVEATWIAAQQRGLAVQPISPVFFARGGGSRAVANVSALCTRPRPSASPVSSTLRDGIRRVTGVGSEAFARRTTIGPQQTSPLRNWESEWARSKLGLPVI